MIKRWFLLPVAALATVLIVVCVCAMFLPATSAAQGVPAYTLRAQQGQVVLCHAGETAPIAKYEIYTVLLPQSDVKALLRGIDARDRAQVQQLLEDLGL